MKMFCVSLLVLGCFFVSNTTNAVGTIQFFDKADYSFEIAVKQPFSMYVNFLYSGDYSPEINLIGYSLPSWLKIGSLASRGTGLYNVELSGTPKVPGDYELTLILSDRNGAIQTRPFIIKIIDTNLVKINKASLLDGFLGKQYSENIDFSWVGIYDPVFSSVIGLPGGISASIEIISKGKYYGEGVIKLNGIPKEEGKFPIKISMTEGNKYNLADSIQELEKITTNKTLILSINKEEKIQPVKSKEMLLEKKEEKKKEVKEEKIVSFVSSTVDLVSTTNILATTTQIEVVSSSEKISTEPQVIKRGFFVKVFSFFSRLFSN